MSNILESTIVGADKASNREAHVTSPPVITIQETKPPETSPEIPESFLKDLCKFRDDCQKRYKFNSRWDNVLNVSGILLSIGIVAAGVYNNGKLAALLGAVVAAAVTTQRAFPFNQRATFYRNLIGQAQNLYADCQYGGLKRSEAIAVMKSLRLDFAQQFPRGTSFKSGSDDK